MGTGTFGAIDGDGALHPSTAGWCSRPPDDWRPMQDQGGKEIYLDKNAN